MPPLSPIVASLVVVVATLLMRLAGAVLNVTSVGLLLVLVVVLIAIRMGRSGGIAAGVTAATAFNFLIIPPTGTLTIADPLNWVSVGVCLTVAVGELSVRARRRAEEADHSRAETERLLHALRSSFARETEAEAARQSDRLRAALIDAVTHDLRTPLTSIKASTTALLQPGATFEEPARHELIEVIDQEADRLDDLVENLLGIARIESGALRLDRQWCAVDDIVSIAVARLGARAAGDRLEVAMPAEIPLVRADARAVVEAVYQLLDNAVRYSPPGSTISVSAALFPGEQVELRVDDQGPGVPVDERERIFDKFARGSAGSSAPVGLGMGLAIAQGLVEAHGGRIGVSDRPDHVPGARFWIRLPIGDEEDGDGAMAAEAPA
ncbi:MAG: ATP-binding protein [Vicinamibacterales bacterium]